MASRLSQLRPLAVIGTELRHRRSWSPAPAHRCTLKDADGSSLCSGTLDFQLGDERFLVNADHAIAIPCPRH
jgi:hypothetical protein